MAIEKPAKLTKPTRFLLARADFFRNGVTYKKGTIFTLPAGERPSVTWVEVDENGFPVKEQAKASDHPVHPPKFAQATLPPAGTEAPKETKSEGKGKRASDTTPL